MWKDINGKTIKEGDILIYQLDNNKWECIKDGRILRLKSLNGTNIVDMDFWAKKMKIVKEKK